MNPLRVLGDILAGRPPATPVRPFDDVPAVGLPDWAERAVLMRREGHDCHIIDHQDALRRLGRAVAERNEARAMADLWMRRALTAEAKLRHPSTGRADAA